MRPYNVTVSRGNQFFIGAFLIHPRFSRYWVLGISADLEVFSIFHDLKQTLKAMSFDLSPEDTLGKTHLFENIFTSERVQGSFSPSVKILSSAFVDDAAVSVCPKLSGHSKKRKQYDTDSLQTRDGGLKDCEIDA